MTFLTPLRPARNRTEDVIERVAAEITSGRLAKGARLPSEQSLMEAFGVSRTVVREALAALKADGLILVRQGAGAFVASDAARIPFRIDPDGLSSVGEIIKLLELRLAVEVEAAGLAAERVSAAGIQAIGAALAAIDTAIASGGTAIEEDFAFHQAIADATGNPNFKDFLSFIGRHVIPRQSVRLNLPDGAALTGYLTRLQKEHREIHKAIAAHNVKIARNAMRSHLRNSLARYRQLAQPRVSKRK